MTDIMSKTLFKGETVQLLPFNSNYWECIASWFFDVDNKKMFRQFNRFLTEDEFKHYPSVIGAEVFMIHSLVDNKVIGMIQAITDSKKNKGCYIGMVIDKEHRGKHIPTESLILFLDHLFNRQGFNKVIMEIVEEDEGVKRSLEAHGFYREGKLIQECFMDGKYINEVRYSMTAFYFNKNKEKFLSNYKQYLQRK